MTESPDIFLRRVDMRDVERLLEWENNKVFWSVSDRKESYTRAEIEAFVEEQSAPVFDLDQIRWMIDSKSHGVVGAIDLYEILWDEDSACIGILVADLRHRQRNIGSASLQQLIHIATEELQLERLFARIQPHNEASIALFTKWGFLKILEDFGRGKPQADYLHYNTFELWLKKSD